MAKQNNDFLRELDSFLTENIDPLLERVRNFQKQYDDCEIHHGIFLTIIPTLITNLCGWITLSDEDRDEIIKDIRETLDGHVRIKDVLHD